MRVLVEYYIVPKQNGYISKVIYHVLNNKLLDASITYIFFNHIYSKTKTYKRSISAFIKNKIFKLKCMI